jgi:hypothetical protein
MKMLEALLESSRAAAIKAKPMRLWQATAVGIAISGLVLLYAVEGVHDIVAGRKHHALLYCGLAALMLMTLPIPVYNFLRVRRGVRVPVLNPSLLFGWPRVPLSVKVALAGSLTILVAIVSYYSLSSLRSSYFRLAFHNHAAFKFLMVVLGFNFFLWVVVAFTWYLFVLTHKQEPIDTKPFVEQVNDVWPPAPSMPDRHHKSNGNLQ